MNYIEIFEKDKNEPIILQFDNENVNLSYQVTAQKTNEESEKIQLLNGNKNFVLREQWNLIKAVDVNNISNVKVTAYDVVLYNIDKAVSNIVYMIDAADGNLIETLLITFVN